MSIIPRNWGQVSALVNHVALEELEGAEPDGGLRDGCYGLQIPKEQQRVQKAIQADSNTT